MSTQRDRQWRQDARAVALRHAEIARSSDVALLDALVHVDRTVSLTGRRDLRVVSTAGIGQRRSPSG